MATLVVRHTTIYRYARPVAFGEHRLMVRPRDSHDLRLLSTDIELAPAASIRWLHDVFGNSIAVASFKEPADELRCVSTLRLEHYPSSEPDFAIEPYARTYPFSYSGAEVPDIGRLAERHYPDPQHRIDAWATEFVAAGADTDTHAMLVDMTKAIKAGFAYVRRDEEGTQTPVETLEKRTGSCRDFALFMMEAVRSLGLGARFVTGYLYGEGSTGGGATHAWVQVYLPGAGWIEFDPTNGLVGSANLIRVGVTRDPSQAIPISGAYTGEPEDYLGMTVEVAIESEA
ncbi:MAG: transglutaminase family protein [bacterium]|nr:transglutaminase family protein [bacterium]